MEVEEIRKIEKLKEIICTCKDSKNKNEDKKCFSCWRINEILPEKNIYDDAIILKNNHKLNLTFCDYKNYEQTISLEVTNEGKFVINLCGAQNIEINKD